MGLEIIITISAILFGSIILSAVGFGIGLTSTPFLLLVIDPKVAVVVVNTVSLPVFVLLINQNRDHINYRSLILTICLVISGVTGVTGFNTTAKIVSVQEARTIGYAQFGAELTVDHDSRVLNSDNAVVTAASARRQLAVSAVTDHTTAGQLFAQQVQISGAQ